MLLKGALKTNLQVVPEKKKQANERTSRCSKVGNKAMNSLPKTLPGVPDTTCCP